MLAKERTIFLADCQSFYASVEKETHPGLENFPVVVAGDPARRSGIILAACPTRRSFSIDEQFLEAHLSQIYSI